MLLRKPIRIVAAICALLLATSSPAALAANAKPGNAAVDRLSAGHLATAYSNEEGTELLGLGFEPKSADAESYTRAICEPNKLMAIVHTGYQEGDDQSSGRQTASNFMHDSGPRYYTMWDHVTGSNLSCVLTTQNAWSGYTFPSYKAGKGEKLDAGMVKRIEKVTQRKVVQHERIGTIGGNTAVALVVYERNGGNPLASIALVTPDTTVLHDLPGTDDPNSTWRVDDAGEIHANHFRVIFAAKFGSAYALGLEWYGAEGSNIYVLKQKKRAFATVEQGYRYMAPV